MKRFLAALVFVVLAAGPAQNKGLSIYESGAFHSAIQPSIYESGWNNWKKGWIWESGAWQPYYSTITVSASSVSGSGSGASSSGFVSSNTPGTSTGGNPIGSPTFSWTYTSGDGGITPSSTTAQNPTWSKTISGVGCSSSSSPSAFWNIQATDPATGAVSNIVNIGIFLSWTNTTSCFTPFTSTYTSGSGCETIPTGSHQVVISVQGGSGGGGYGENDGVDDWGGGGGGSGGWAQDTRSVNGSDYGNCISFSVGIDGSPFATPDGSASTVSGSVSGGGIGITAGGGHSGLSGTPGPGGAAGGASGGDTNNSGHAGDNGTGSSGGSGGGPPSGGDGQGGDGGFGASGPGTNGSGIYIIFAWT